MKNQIEQNLLLKRKTKHHWLNDRLGPKRWKETRFHSNLLNNLNLTETLGN